MSNFCSSRLGWVTDVPPPHQSNLAPFGCHMITPRSLSWDIHSIGYLRIGSGYNGSKRPEVWEPQSQVHLKSQSHNYVSSYFSITPCTDFLIHRPGFVIPCSSSARMSSGYMLRPRTTEWTFPWVCMQDYLTNKLEVVLQAQVETVVVDRYDRIDHWSVVMIWIVDFTYLFAIVLELSFCVNLNSSILASNGLLSTIWLNCSLSQLDYIVLLIT